MSKLKNIVFLTFVLFVLSSCTTKSPTPTAAVTDVTDVTESPTAEATATAAPITNECLNCHTEKQRLIDTAKPVVVAEAESKGVG